MNELFLAINPDTLVYVGFLTLSILVYVTIMMVLERTVTIFKKDKRPFTPLKTALFCFLGLSLTIPTLFLIHWSAPVHIPTYTLSNGEKTIVFQGMQHLGDRDYYVQVDKDIRTARNDGYTIFREGIGAKGSAIFSLKTCDIAESNNFLNGIEQPGCLGGIMSKDIYADISMDDLKRYYAKEAKEKGLDAEAALKHENESFEKTISFLTEATGDRSNSFTYYMMQPYFVHKSIATKMRNGIITVGKMGEFDALIMDERNRVLTDNLLQAKNNKLYVFYGVGHFNGTLELLQQNDSNWKITKVEYLKSM